MELLLFLFKVNMALLVFYLFYKLALRRLTFYNFNRIYLLLAIVLSATLPLLSYTPTIGSRLSDWQYATGIRTASVMETMDRQSGWSPEVVVGFVYWSGVVVMGIIFLVQLLSLAALYSHTPKTSLFGMRIRKLEQGAAPFSFFRSVFIDPEAHTDGELKSILQHEQVHSRQLHSADVLLGEVKRIFCWFNPAAWLILSAIRENLEFIADREVLRRGIDAKSYQYSLLAVQYSDKKNALANNFNLSHLKLRITMMNKTKTSDLHLVKYLMAVPVIAFVSLLTYNAGAQNKPEERTEKKVIIVNGQSFDADELAELKPEEIKTKLGLENGADLSIEVKSAIDESSNSPGLLKAENGQGSKTVLKLVEANELPDQNLPGAEPGRPGKGETVELVAEQVKVKLDSGDYLELQLKSAEGMDIKQNGNELQLTGPSDIYIRQDKNTDASSPNKPLIYINGELVKDIFSVKPMDVESIIILKGAEAKAIRPDVNQDQGIIQIKTKNAAVADRPRPADNAVVYPNPASDYVQVKVNSAAAGNTYELYDRNGVLQGKGSLKPETTISTRNMVPGIYFIQMNIEGTRQDAKFEVMK